MRLICPECNALYDIADAMIPPEGREVECSACGHVWLQLPAATARPVSLSGGGAGRTAPVGDQRDEDTRGEQADTGAAPAPETSVPADENAASDAGDQKVPFGQGGSDAPSGMMRGLAADLRAAAQRRADPVPALGDAPVLQRPLPDDVLSILREETARELHARRAVRDAAPATIAAPSVPAPALVVPSPQPAPPAGPVVAAPVAETPASQDLDLPGDEPLADWPATTVTRPDIGPDDDLPTESPQATPQFAAAKASPVPDQAAAPPESAATVEQAPPERPPVPRRRVSRILPDAEELAATIQTEIPVAEAPAVPAVLPAPAAQPRSGYRSGFWGAISVAAALMAAYVAGAAWVDSGRAPDAVAALVGGVDDLRAGLHDAVTAALGRKEP